MDEPFEVHPYSIGVLRNLIANKAEAYQWVIDCKPHCEYFQSYFEHLQAKTIIVENDYIDRDFLDDYAAYYVLCFHPYRRRCTRLHFFSNSFEQADFECLLEGTDTPLTTAILNKDYLGFVVVKPLPETVIGRTCLRSYEEEGGRNYPITRSYDASLFGIDLEVKKTLAFQEQDHVVAACATSALWSAFQGTGKLFQHAIPSPVEITAAAGVNPSTGSRNFPNDGLTRGQMAQAVRSMGLEPLWVPIRDEFVFKNTLYAYMCGEIPILMLVGLFDTSQTEPIWMGNHAIAATGFGIRPENVTGAREEFRIKASGIDRIYGHDDGIGPFARMRLDGETVRVQINGHPPTDWLSLSTSWKTDSGVPGKVRAVPNWLLIPLYHKIRIPYELVENSTIQFDSLVEFFRKHDFLPISERLRWDIRLSTVREFKRSVINCTTMNQRHRRSVLLKSLPRFLWRATAYYCHKPVLDLLFDATDIEQGKCFVRAVKYNTDFAAVLGAAVRMKPFEDAWGQTAAWTILKQFGDTEDS